MNEMGAGQLEVGEIVRITKWVSAEAGGARKLPDKYLPAWAMVIGHKGAVAFIRWLSPVPTRDELFQQRTTDNSFHGPDSDAQLFEDHDRWTVVPDDEVPDEVWAKAVALKMENIGV